MARINLLPWREERRKQRNIEAQGLFAAAAVFGIAVVLGLVWHFGKLIEDQQARNQYLTQQIAEVDRQIKRIEELEKTRAQLLGRKQVIEQLQASRSMMVHLFDELVRTIPEGVRLKSIKQAGDVLTLEGSAESNARVSDYMKRFESSEWIGSPDLQIVEARGEDRRNRYNFILRVTLKKPKVEGEEEAQAVAS
jgi:type IV pilus assembly protein PilN